MAMPNLRFYQFGQKRTIPKNMGKTVNWTRYTRLAGATTALTEAVNPCQTSLTASTISATVAEYGAFTKSSSLVNLTAIDPELKSAVEILGKQANETLDNLVRAVVSVTGTTPLYPNSHVLSTIVASDVMTASQVRRAVRALKLAMCPTFKDGSYGGIVTVDQGYDLLSDSNTGAWIDINKYTDPSPLYKGELGKLYGARIVETPIGHRSATTNTTYGATGAVHYSSFV
jgi:N4-gp56 family major capsid protein